jgi:cephalosporin hydroxylase
MTKKELKQELQSILEILKTATQDATASSHRYSEKDVNARMAYEVGYLGGRIAQAVNDLELVKQLI